MHCGAILSGEKLIDDKSFKQSILEQYPTAIGGEMEGSGLWASADRHRKEWLVVKGVCDWADGEKNDYYQDLAATASVSLCEGRRTKICGGLNRIALFTVTYPSNLLLLTQAEEPKARPRRFVSFFVSVIKRAEHIAHS